MGAYNCVYEIGVKLAHVLWRKVLSDDRSNADHALNDHTIYELIVRGQYDLAIILGEFATQTIKKHGNDSVRRRLVLNLAQAYKWSGKPEKCVSLVAKEDWSSSRDEFNIAVAVLKDDFSAAQEIMKRLGRDGMAAEAYPYWPIFREFRKTKEFAEAYEGIFGVPFSTIQTVATPKGRVAKHLRDVINAVDSADAQQRGPEYVI